MSDRDFWNGTSPPKSYSKKPGPTSGVDSLRRGIPGKNVAHPIQTRNDSVKLGPKTMKWNRGHDSMDNPSEAV